ncbi:MAG: hypothetical protein WCR55_13585, partial [Lentisphaerota bacterium]
MKDLIKKTIKTNSLTNTVIYKPYLSWRKKNIEKRKRNSSELNILGLEFGTDKVDDCHTYNSLTYLDIYEKYFLSIRHEKLKILEIGVRGG